MSQSSRQASETSGWTEVGAGLEYAAGAQRVSVHGYSSVNILCVMWKLKSAAADKGWAEALLAAWSVIDYCCCCYNTA